MDLGAGTSTFLRSDAKEATFETGYTRDPESRVARIQCSPSLRAVLMTTTSGDQVALPPVTASNPAAVGDRPVVHLDQNQWSALARIENGEALATAEEGPGRRRSLIGGQFV